MLVVTQWRQKRWIAVVLTAGILLVQLAIPASRLADENEPSVRFGWQMFSTLTPSVKFTVITRDGELDIDTEDYLARLRGDLALTVIFPPHLCDVVEGAQSVTWEDGGYRC